MESEMRLACVPATKEAQERLGLLYVQIKNNYTKGICDRCGVEVWIGPKQQAMKYKNPEMKINCFACIDPKEMDGPPISLGGEGCDYFTKDGKIFAQGNN